RLQQWMTGFSRFHHGGRIASQRELQQPRGEGQQLRGINSQRRLATEHSLYGLRQLTGASQRNHMTGTDIATVAVGTRSSKSVFVDQSHAATGLAEIPCSESSDHAPADND